MLLSLAVAYSWAEMQSGRDIHLSPFGDIKDVPDSCDEEVGFFIGGSSSPICSSSKMVLSLSVAYSCAEIQSVTDQPTDQC